MIQKITLALFAILLLNEAYAQDILSDFKKHVYYLADDKLEGREPGTEGEKLAYEYIVEEFKMSGLEPIGTNGFLQPFQVFKGQEYTNENFLALGKRKVKLEEEYFPVIESANGYVSGKVVDVGYGLKIKELDINSYEKTGRIEGRIALIDVSHPEGDNPHSNYAPFSTLRRKIETANEMGAIGVIFYAKDSENIDPRLSRNLERTTLPAVFVKKETYRTLSKIKRAQFSVGVKKIFHTANNVLGFIDNGAKNTIVLGGHYDHLGMGHYGSRWTGQPDIHNGADDNASGIALLLEFAQMLKSEMVVSGSNYLNNNYLILAFSGEEMGLLGSKHFVENPTIELDEINYMLNFDMIGRLEEGKLSINAVGTSPSWDIINDIKTGGIESIVTTESGVGPSDHTSFYLKDIPVLAFFTGAHNDYHTPRDDAELINYEGMLSIYEYSLALISKLNAAKKIEFTKTKDSNNSGAPKFSVTLGVMPDYTFESGGMRIDAVTKGKTADIGGLEAGDIVIQMGNIPVEDMMAYMKALSQFKKGDETKVKVMRGEEELEFDVTF